MPKQLNEATPPSAWVRFITESKGYILSYKGKDVCKWEVFLSYQDFDAILRGETPVTCRRAYYPYKHAV